MATEPNKLAELRAAIAALQDDHIEYEYRAPWYVHHLDSTSIVSCRNCDVAEADCPEVATYIAAADPQTVLALVEEVERLRNNLTDLLVCEADRRDLRAEVEKLRGALGDIVSICGGGTTDRVSPEFLMGTPGEVRLCVANLRAEVEHRTRERDEARAELAKGTVTMTATVDQQGRLEGFAKAALTGLCSGSRPEATFGELARASVEIAQATISAIDAVLVSSFALSNEAPPR